VARLERVEAGGLASGGEGKKSGRYRRLPVCRLAFFLTLPVGVFFECFFGRSALRLAFSFAPLAGFSRDYAFANVTKLLIFFRQFVYFFVFSAEKFVSFFVDFIVFFRFFFKKKIDSLEYIV